MLMNKSKLNGLLNADTVIVQKKTAAAVNQPVSEPAKSVSELPVSTGKDFCSLVKEGFAPFHIVGAHTSGFPVFIIFCHVASDRGRQTYRSENVQTVMGILCPATVRPAPVFFFYMAGLQ